MTTFHYGGILAPNEALNELRENRKELEEWRRDFKYWRVKGVRVHDNRIIISLNRPSSCWRDWDDTILISGPNWFDRWRGDKVEFKAERELGKWIEICKARNVEITRVERMNKRLNDQLEWLTK